MWKLNFQWQLLLEILLQRSCLRDMSKSAPKPRVGKYIPQKQPELVPSPLLCTAEAEEGACLGGRWNMMERRARSSVKYKSTATTTLCVTSGGRGG